ncbi:MAG: hypothetical protein KF868_04285 [Acidobacteria bacterium]|nr:hypothetical protein [Acidobacteriota bacterium]
MKESLRGKVVSIFFGLAVLAGYALSAHAQDATQVQSPEQEALNKKALALLDGVIADSMSLRLPENRARVQIAAADLLWERDEGRARALFAEAGAAIAEMMRSLDPNDRQYANQLRVPAQLRQELLLTAARYDATIAYQLLQTTRPPQPVMQGGTPGIPGRGGRPIASETDVEQSLLAQIAALDPKLALQNAEEMLARGEYSNTLSRVLGELNRKDRESAAKFSDKLVRKLQSENLIANRDAGSLAVVMLQAGPMPETKPGEVQIVSPRSPRVLAASTYQNLLESVVNAVLKAPATNPQQGAGARGQNNPRAGQRQNNPRGGQNNQNTQPSEEQLQQMNARVFAFGVQSLLPRIDEYAPSRAAGVREKLAAMGMRNLDQRAALNQFTEAMQQGTADAMIAAAATMPQQMQSRIYRQAALRALDEGDVNRARQIAGAHLEPAERDSVLKTIELRAAAKQAGTAKIEEIRGSLSRLRTDDERVRQLIQLVQMAKKDNPPLASLLLEDARNLVNRRANNYQQFDLQLQVARAYADVDSSRSFEILESGIRQLNEMLPAAAMLSGFDLNVFKDGEMPIQGGGQLGRTVQRYAEELAELSKYDFDRAQSEADRFYLAEPRLMARLAMVREIFGIEPVETNAEGGQRGFGQAPPFVRR